MKKFLECTLIFLITLFSFNINVIAEELTIEPAENLNEIELLNENEIINNLNSEKFELNNEETNNNLQNEELNIKDVKNEEIKLQYTKVSISKVNEKNELIIGAKLQIIDSTNTIIKEWISDGTVYEIMLPAGKYILHEIEAPEGYELAEDKPFEIEVIIEENIEGNVNWNEYPCDHGEDNQTPLYYVEINSISYETYCINQGVATPNGIDYNGKIITPDDIRNYTKQETNVDTEGYTISGTRINVNTETISDYDVSDQTLTNQELYDKILDIIYHRQLAEKDEKFSELSIAEIRFITEFALKNYLNARITTYETVRVLNGTKISHTSFNKDGELWQTGDGTKYIKLYNKYYNREYLYDETSPTGYIISEGNGDSFGNFAKHWYHGHGSTKIPKIYAELFYYLISDDNNHPESMQLYIYSPTATYSDTPYQNLLGITGFIEDIEIKEQAIKLTTKYSEEKRDIKVEKIWEENKETQTETKPEKVTVNLYADEELYDSVELNDNNNWSHTFNDLNIYNEGKKIIYTIDEIKIPQYETLIEGNMDEGFKITNIAKKLPEQDFKDPENIKNPDTSDNIYSSIIISIISLTGIIFASLYIKSK